MAIDCFGDKSGKVTTLLGVPEGLSGTDKVKVEGILMYTVGGYVSAAPSLLQTPKIGVARADNNVCRPLSSSPAKGRSQPSRRTRNG